MRVRVCVVCCVYAFLRLVQRCLSHRETATALQHLSSIHAAETRRANAIHQSSGKVNEGASAQIRRSEYLSAIHTVDSAAAMAMPPVLGLREAVDLTQRARTVLADQAITASLATRLALEAEAAEAAELAKQEGWSRRRDPRAEAARSRREAAAKAASGRKKKTDAELMQMVSMTLAGKSFGAGLQGAERHKEEDDELEEEEDEEALLRREAAERKRQQRASQRRAAGREAEVGACEHNLALLQLLLGRPATEWQETLSRAVAAMDRAEEAGRVRGAAGLLPAAARMYVSKVRKTYSVLGRVSRVTSTADSTATAAVAQQQEQLGRERPSTAPNTVNNHRSVEQRHAPWTAQPAFDASTRPSTSSGEGSRQHLNSQRNESSASFGTRPQTAPSVSPFAVAVYSLPDDGRGSSIAQVWTAAGTTSSGSDTDGGRSSSSRPPLCEVAVNRGASARSVRKVAQAAEIAARDRRIAERSARPRTAPGLLLNKKPNRHGIEQPIPDPRQLAALERLSPRGTAALFEAFQSEQRSKDGVAIGDSDGISAGVPQAQRQHQQAPPPGSSRYAWSCARASESRKQQGIFKLEMSRRKHTHRDRRGRRGAALSLNGGEMDWRTQALGGQSFSVNLL